MQPDTCCAGRSEVEMRMQKSWKYRQISRLKGRHDQREVTRGEEQRSPQTDEISPPLNLTTYISVNACQKKNKVGCPRWHRNKQIRACNVPCLEQDHQLADSRVKERCNEKICVIPKARDRGSNEVRPSASLQAKKNSSDVHPCLKEVEPSNVLLPVCRDEENSNERAGSENQRPVRVGFNPLCRFHTDIYVAATKKFQDFPEGSFSFTLPLQQLEVGSRRNAAFISRLGSSTRPQYCSALRCR